MKEEILTAKTITPIEVNLVLRDDQFLNLNKWRATIDGELRELPSKYVTFYALGVSDIFTRYKPSECQSATIKINYNK